TKYGVYDCVDFYKQPAFDNPLLRNLTSKVAVVQTVFRPEDPTKDFHGIHGSISLHKPKAEKTQWSSARIKLINGDESMELGWMVS
ncbi:30S ribosomal protein S6, partial [Bienertia sinuspersici]